MGPETQRKPEAVASNSGYWGVLDAFFEASDNGPLSVRPFAAQGMSLRYLGIVPCASARPTELPGTADRDA